MGWYRRYAVVVFGLNRRNLLTAAALAVLVAVGYWLTPTVVTSSSTVAGIQYAVVLTVFCVWMVWFVAAGVDVWRARGFGDPD